MKRLYLAIVMTLLCIFLGVFEFATINYSTDKCLNNLTRINREIENQKYSNAIKICKKTAAEYEKFTEKILFCYLNHKEFDNINTNLTIMTEALNNKDLYKYNELYIKTKKQLLTLKSEELLSIQNIL